MTIIAGRYSNSDRDSWNDFNAVGRNGHFLFDRPFMEYHSDRFADASLVLREEDAVVGIVPLNRSEATAYSHQGLTFGGLVTGAVRTPAVMALLDATVENLRAEGFRTLIYKAMPHIYHRRPSEEDLYWLVRNGARLVRRDVSSTIRHAEPGTASSRRRRGAARATKSGVELGRSDDWSGFWKVLTKNLAERHDVAPVHSLDEITRLAAAFPANIHLYVATGREGDVIAGVVAFNSPTVMHAQYIAASAEGREMGALDGLFQFIIEQSRSSGHAYFDFGISTEDQGRTLNVGLITYKEEFGASATVYDSYELSL